MWFRSEHNSSDPAPLTLTFPRRLNKKKQKTDKSSDHSIHGSNYNMIIIVKKSFKITYRHTPPPSEAHDCSTNYFPVGNPAIYFYMTVYSHTWGYCLYPHLCTIFGLFCSLFPPAHTPGHSPTALLCYLPRTHTLRLSTSRSSLVHICLLSWWMYALHFGLTALILCHCLWPTGLLAQGNAKPHALSLFGDS